MNKVDKKKKMDKILNRINKYGGIIGAIAAIATIISAIVYIPVFLDDRYAKNEIETEVRMLTKKVTDIEYRLHNIEIHSEKLRKKIELIMLESDLRDIEHRICSNKQNKKRRSIDEEKKLMELQFKQNALVKKIELLYEALLREESMISKLSTRRIRHKA